METQLKNRSIAPDGPAIQRRRIEKGWRVVDLAKKAGCSVKTVENVEKGANTLLYTLSKVAQALGVEISALMPKTAPLDPPHQERRFKVQLTLDIPFEDFDECEQLASFLAMLNQIVQAKHEITVAGVEMGSTIITLEMNMDDIQRLIDVFDSPDREIEARLEPFRVASLKLPDGEDFTLTKTLKNLQDGTVSEEPLRGRVYPFGPYNVEVLGIEEPPEIGIEPLVPEHKPAETVVALGFATDNTLWSVEKYGVLRNWDFSSQKQVDRWSLDDLVETWCFNNTTRLLAGGDSKISVWMGPTGHKLAEWDSPAWTTALSFSPNSQALVSGHDDGIVRVWDWPEHKLLQQLSGHQKPVSSVAFSRDGLKLASADENRQIRIWDAQKGQLLTSLAGHSDRIPALAWHPDGKRLVSASWDTTVRVWDVATGEPIILLNNHFGMVLAMAFSPDGRLLACADDASNVHILDFDSYHTLHVLSEPVRDCSCLAFSLDGQMLAAGGTDCRIFLWDAQRELQLNLTDQPQVSRTCVITIPDDPHPQRASVSQP